MATRGDFSTYIQTYKFRKYSYPKATSAKEACEIVRLMRERKIEEIKELEGEGRTKLASQLRKYHGFDSI